MTRMLASLTALFTAGVLAGSGEWWGAAWAFIAAYWAFDSYMTSRCYFD